MKDVKKEKAIRFNTEWYAEKIMDIFTRSRNFEEEKVYAVNIGQVADAMQIEVAYSEEQVANKQFFHELGLNKMRDGEVKEIVKRINQDEAPLLYREKIQEYIKENFEEDFEVDEFIIIFKQ